MHIDTDVVPFEPHPLVPGGDAQTIVGRYLPGPTSLEQETKHLIELPDGDKLCVLESKLSHWREGGPAALLVHGLAGCARSPYVMRIGRDLARLGVRVLAMNLRGAGDGFGHAKQTYHSGKSEDLRAVLDWYGKQAADSKVALIGFSLGGNLVLKLAAEASTDPVGCLDCVIAANPPIDLEFCSLQLKVARNRLYDWNFVRILKAEVDRLHTRFPELGSVDLRNVRTVFEFDDAYTSMRHGFAGALDYYRRASSAPLLERIEIPGLVIHAADDPFIPPSQFTDARFPASLELDLVAHGGHLGFLSRRPWSESRRWLDRRILAWLVKHWQGRGSFSTDDSSFVSSSSLGESLTTGSHSR